LFPLHTKRLHAHLALHRCVRVEARVLTVHLAATGTNTAARRRRVLPENSGPSSVVLVVAPLLPRFSCLLIVYYFPPMLIEKIWGGDVGT
jgi:hypothetical protein